MLSIDVTHESVVLIVIKIPWCWGPARNVPARSTVIIDNPLFLDTYTAQLKDLFSSAIISPVIKNIQNMKLSNWRVVKPELPYCNIASMCFPRVITDNKSLKETWCNVNKLYDQSVSFMWGNTKTSKLGNMRWITRHSTQKSLRWKTGLHLWCFGAPNSYDSRCLARFE
jgi:hypothetical protein